MSTYNPCPSPVCSTSSSSSSLSSSSSTTSCRSSKSKSKSKCKDKKKRCKDKKKSKKCKIKEKCPCMPIDDNLTKKIECDFKAMFSDVQILCKGSGVLTLTHSIPCLSYTINGAGTRSILTNNGFLTSECGCNGYINLYQISLPDFQCKYGGDSTVELFTKLINKYGLTIAGVGTSFLGYNLKACKCSSMITVHVQNTGLSVTEFACRILKVLSEVLCVIKKRMD